MSEKVRIETTKQVYPQIYAYTLPTQTEKDGWIKIGYTKREDVHDRIREQTHTAAMKLQYELLWHHPARYSYKPDYFMDHQLHQFLTTFKKVTREPGTEWFYYNGTPEKAEEDFKDFIDGKREQASGVEDYQLREEQAEAVARTLAYFQDHPGGEFLWNAKPRFGKTLTAYDLMMKMDCHNVLVLTNRPAIADSWFNDFEKFIAWRKEYGYQFVSTTDSLKGRPSMTHEEYIDLLLTEGQESHRQVAFLSLQDLKGSVSFGGPYAKLQWVQAKHTAWDLVIVDEAHEGKDTIKSEIALDQIKRKATLNLSGTPFKQLSSGNFTEEQIYNWTYSDEQQAKASWNAHHETYNPYEKLPRLTLFTYQIGPMITDSVNSGANINGENRDYAFDLREFFETNEQGNFIHEKDVRKWIETLFHNEKYPFSTKELRNELKHTFWILDRVKSAKALAKLLKEHLVFENYEIIVAAGDGKPLDDETMKTEAALKRVKEAIQTHDKTITLSVGQLTTGVTIPEWTAVIMLNNGQSAAKYMQTAFRAQNPWEYTEGGVRRQKETAYVFDFNPSRSLPIFSDFATNLNISTANGRGTTEVRKESIQQLLNFFPVIAEDAEGKMVPINVEQVLTIPNAYKAREVVSRGFMSNLLFQNIGGIFANQEAREILEHLKPTEEGKTSHRPPIDTQDVVVDEQGEVVLDDAIVISKTAAIFGKKIYQTMAETTAQQAASNDSEMKPEKADTQVRQTLAKTFQETMTTAATTLQTDLDLTKAAVKTIVQANTNVLEREIQKVQATQRIEMAELTHEYEAEVEALQAEPDTPRAQIDEVMATFEEKKQALQQAQQATLVDTVTKKTEELVTKTTEDMMRRSEEKKQHTTEDDVRARLRGFARTIPSFLMAYGTPETTLATFDTTIKDDVFKEVTGITLDQFRYLRDTCDFFDEAVFNESVREFLNKRRELANYFDDTHDEDIFDYIPPQQTNQIFTPKKVVKMMVDQLEAEDPTLFQQPDKTFADLYMKSGLYITEIVTRLYKGLEAQIPDNHERIKHILEHQVYGFAPTEIIYHIARNFIFGFDDSAKNINDSHIVHLDTTPYAKGEGDLAAKCDELFGGK